MSTEFAPRFVLRHKFAPPGRPAEVLSRPRVARAIGRLHAECSVVVCVGGPGAGKTVQAQLYAASSGIPVAWLTLDPADRTAHRLVASLATALEAYTSDGTETVENALRSGLSAQEAAAVLAETVLPNPFLFVIDECETVTSSDDAITVLATFLDYAPPSIRVMLLSREHFRGMLRRRCLEGSFGMLPEDELRLTPEETESLVDVLGFDDVEAADVHAATGGWMAGIVFGFRGGASARGNDCSAEFASYVGQEVLGGLTPDEQRFLLDTSVLDIVTPELTEALLGPGGRGLFERVRARKLPATTVSQGEIIYHSLLRSFLRTELLRTDPGRELQLRRCLAEHLAGTGRHEDATELYLGIGDLDSAADTAERACPAMFRAGGWAALIRWADALGEERVDQRPMLLAARIRALGGARRYEEAAQLVERADRLGQLRRATACDSGLLATIGALLLSRPALAMRYLDKYAGDFRVEAVRYTVGAVGGVGAVVPPPGGRNWDDVGSIMTWGLLWQGRLAELLRLVPDAEDSPAIHPNVMLALLWRGDVETARAMWGRVPAKIRQQPYSRYIEASILLAEGEPESALSTIEEAIAASRPNWYGLGDTYEMFAAQVMVIQGRVEDALDLVESRIGHLAETGQLELLEWAQTILGAAFLKANRPADAELVLDECVQAMSQARRRLYLPVAAVYLAAAKLRLGKDDAATDAAELAYHTASIMGCVPMLVAALRTVPQVVEHQRARVPGDTRWQRIRFEPDAGPDVVAVAENDVASLYVQPFGASRELFVNDVATSVGRLKVVELAAYLTLHPAGVDRFELQRQLFPDTDQRRGGNHFRQIAHKLREATGIGLVRSAGNVMSWPDHLSVDAADLRFERLVDDARAAAGPPRLDGLLCALELVTGSYLQNSDLAWADERRYQLEIALEEVLLEAAGLLLDDRRFEETREHTERVLVVNPYSEPAYRTLMQVERLIGTESSAMAVYRRAVDALSELGLEPDVRMRRLLRTPMKALND
jgi:ATP/maltotriose-dependent transcriptional regulator MalT/DNA-binding SARP family transcriptional activator